MAENHFYEHVDTYLQMAVEYDASDIHLTTGSPPVWRRHGNLMPIWDDAENFTNEQIETLITSFLDAKCQKILVEIGDADSSYENAFARYRCSVVRHRLGKGIVFRIIKSEIRTMQDLKLPEEFLVPLTRYHNGLILITGSVGSGKSTTLAGMVDFINKDRRDHILSLEDPIEFVHTPQGCHINQREIGEHSESFPRALRAALREDPDVIIVGEMRNLETIQLAITAAETGHLVLGTLHTGNAPRTLDRILDVFPIDQRGQIRVMVAESLRGIISQQLVPAADGNGRCLALEILVNNPAVAATIRDGKTFMLPGIMQTGKSIGMTTMDDSLRELYISGQVTAEEVLHRCEDRTVMREFLQS
ncbi:MAG: twitching motility protein PilT [Rubritalea sp.]|jgi:twitching motility protein PilT